MTQFQNSNSWSHRKPKPYTIPYTYFYYLYVSSTTLLDFPYLTYEYPLNFLLGVGFKSMARAGGDTSPGRDNIHATAEVHGAKILWSMCSDAHSKQEVLECTVHMRKGNGKFDVSSRPQYKWQAQR